MTMTNEELIATNEELIAKARELCEAHIKEIETEIRYYDYQIGANIDSIRLGLRQNLNSWTTHLAEMDEQNLVVEHLSKSELPYDKELLEVAIRHQVTKAKRLLGVE